jgi:hypothetical protein
LELGLFESLGRDSPNQFLRVLQQVFEAFLDVIHQFFVATSGSNPATVIAWDDLIFHD